MIGDTASISLLTGLPGAGKSLRFVERMVELIKSGEHVYCCNLNGVKIPGLTPWDDPKQWPELPAGAILFIDEAQEFFGARRSGLPEPMIKLLSKIRHAGIRLVLATQQPDYLDTYVRGLVGFHEHLYRQSGKGETFIFRNHQLMEQVKMPFKRIKSMYDYEKWKLPKECFKYYTSAEIHTVAYRMPAILKRALVLGPLTLLLFAGTLYGVYWFNTSRVGAVAASPDQARAEGPEPERGAQSAAHASRSGGEVKTVDEYVGQFVPRVPSQPWSAQFYDDMAPPPVPPRVFCMIGGEGDGSTCTCLTDQGTRYDMPSDQCRVVARDGQYEPYLQREERDSVASSDTGAGQAVNDEERGAVASPVGSVAFGRMATYGDHAMAPAGTLSVGGE